MPKKRIVIEVGPNPGETAEAARLRVFDEVRAFLDEMFEGDDVRIAEEDWKP